MTTPKTAMLTIADEIEKQAAPYNRDEKEDVMPIYLTPDDWDRLVAYVRRTEVRPDDGAVRVLEEIAQLTNVGRGDLISLQDAMHDIHKLASGSNKP